VSGQIDPVGKGYVLSVNLLNATDGHVLTAARETAESEGDLLPAIDRLSKRLRERVGESLVSIRNDRPLEQVTTASLPALRKYSEALRLEEEDKLEAAIPLLQQAVALDSGFAMAYRKLAVMLGNVGGHGAESNAAATRAYSHRDRLPELEADLTSGYYHQFVEYDPDSSMAAYRAALAAEPDNLVALNNLSIVLSERRQWAEAESLTTRAARLGRGSTFTGNLMVAQVAQGHYASAAAALARFAERAPASPAVLSMRANLAAAQHDYPAAIRLFSQLRASQSSSPSWQALTGMALARLSRLTGRLGDAEHYLREYAAGSESRGALGDYLAGTVELSLLESDLRGRPDSALGVLGAALARHSLAAIPAPERPYPMLIIAYVKAGRPEVARRIAREYEAAVPIGMRRAAPLRHYAAGLLAEAEGKRDVAATEYRAWYDEAGICNSCGLFALARLADAAAQADSALALYDRGFTAPSLYRYTSDAFELAPALKRAGELSEAKGDRARAAERYRQLVDLWKNADPALQPALRDLRGRVARLATEPGS
jgi:eukaryotic-like serine/threonine-protein kinase